MLLATLAVRTTSRSSCSALRTERPESRSALRSVVVFLLCAILAHGELRIELTEGDGLTQAPGSTSYRGLSVRILTPQGDPVPNARVWFRLPENEPSGMFPNGTRGEQVVTDGKGEASVWGIKWGSAPGTCNISITATDGKSTAGTVARIRLGTVTVQPETAVASFEVTVSAPRPNTEPPATVKAPESPPSVTVAPLSDKRPGVLLTQGTGRVDSLPNPWVKRTLIILAITGAAGGFAVYKLTRPGAPPPATLGVVPTPLTLSSPTISIGKP